MPYKRRGKRSRGSYRRRRRRIRKTRVARGIRSLIPRKQVVNLPYHTVIVLNASSGATAGDGHAFRCNSIYDPDYTTAGTTGKPLGYAQMLALYKNYKVLGSKMVATFHPKGDFPSAQIIVKATDTTIEGKSRDEVMEQPNCFYKTTNSHDGGSNKVVLWSKFSAKRDFGPDDDSSAAMTADPAHTMYYHIFSRALALGDDPSDVVVDVRINYITQFYNSKFLDDDHD